MVDFLIVIIEHFSLALTVQTIGRSRRFSNGGQFERKFQMEGDITHQHLWVSEN